MTTTATTTTTPTKTPTHAIPTGRFVWFDYLSNDRDRARGFYGELFGWTTKEMPGNATYSMISAGDRMIGGFAPLPPTAPQHGHWLPHLQVASAAATIKEIEAAGGKVRMAPVAMGEHGSYAVVADPLGGTFCLWQPTAAQGTGDFAGVANSFCWIELATQDPARSAAFYERIGGMTSSSDANMADYTMLSSGGAPRAGIVKVPPQVPQAWVPYVQVEGCDAAIARAVKLGGNVRMPAMDTPKVGRHAVIADPQGGVIGLLQPAA